MIVPSHSLGPGEVAYALANQRLMTDEQREFCINSPHLVWVVKRRKSLPAAIRKAVIERDGNTCVYCAEPADPLHLDHRLPVSRGGQDTLENLCVACVDCNLAKGALTPEEWRQ